MAVDMAIAEIIIISVPIQFQETFMRSGIIVIVEGLRQRMLNMYISQIQLLSENMSATRTILIIHLFLKAGMIQLWMYIKKKKLGFIPNLGIKQN